MNRLPKQLLSWAVMASSGLLVVSIPQVWITGRVLSSPQNVSGLDFPLFAIVSILFAVALGAAALLLRHQRGALASVAIVALGLICCIFAMVLILGTDLISGFVPTFARSRVGEVHAGLGAYLVLGAGFLSTLAGATAAFRPPSRDENQPNDP